MIIYFFTKEEIVCDSLIQAANFNGHECFVSKDFETIYEKTLETQLEPDLFVLDYTLFNPLLFNPFKFLTSKNLFIPLIIYNDPFAPKEFKVGYWKNLLKTFYPTNRINFEKYNQIFNTLENTLMYLEHKESDTKIEEEEKNKQLILNNIKSNKKYDTYNNFGDYLVINDKIKSDIKNNEPIFSLLTGSAYTIFKKLYTHKNNVIPIKELQNSISKTKEPKPTTVYCIISNIRKLIKNHGNNYNIIKIGDGYKLQ